MLPTITSLRTAIELYLKAAFGTQLPATIEEQFLPPIQTDPQEWLMRPFVERDPADAPLEQVRSFALRVGNRRYPFMKLRLTRLPRRMGYVFCVDAHDAVLHARPGTSDAPALEQMKRFNAQLTGEIVAVWDAAGLPTERAYLRQVIQEARERNANPKNML